MLIILLHFALVLHFAAIITFCGVTSFSLILHLMKNQHILFFTDNEAVVHAINKQSCKDKHLMHFV